MKEHATPHSDSFPTPGMSSLICVINHLCIIDKQCFEIYLIALSKMIQLNDFLGNYPINQFEQSLPLVISSNNDLPSAYFVLYNFCKLLGLDKSSSVP